MTFQDMASNRISNYLNLTTIRILQQLELENKVDKKGR